MLFLARCDETIKTRHVVLCHPSPENSKTSTSIYPGPEYFYFLPTFTPLSANIGQY